MQILSKQDVQRIKAEHQKYLDEGAEITIPLHQRILATWKADSPAMYLRLRTQGVLEAMAFVCQQRMWDEQARLMKAGMPVTDAREQAERQHLMLEPESAQEPPQESAASGLAAVQQAMDEGRQALLRAGL